MGIFLRQSWNVKPPLWGSPADRQYAIWDNLEKIYRCDHESEVLIMPLFWGLPPLDYSKYGNHGTNHGATYKDGSLDFDGVDDYVDCGSGSSLEIVGNITIFAWIKLNGDYLNTQTIVSDFEIVSPYENSYQLEFGRTNNEFGWYHGATEIGSSSISLADDNLHNIVVTRTGSAGNWDISYYFDGIFDETDNTAVDPGGQTAGTTIGRSGTYNSQYFNGLIDEVRISNVARTADQIALFHDRPWDLYRPVSRPIWSIPAAPSTFVPQIMIF